MNPNLIYYPCFALIVLTVIVLLRMFSTRVKAVKNGTVDFKHFKTYGLSESELPREMIQASKNFTNLFEVPTLFYFICLFALITRNVDKVILTLAWLYVVFRYVHSFIHLTNNKIMPRMFSYMLSWIFLIIMSILLVVRI